MSAVVNVLPSPLKAIVNAVIPVVNKVVAAVTTKAPSAPVPATVTKTTSSPSIASKTTSSTPVTASKTETKKTAETAKREADATAAKAKTIAKNLTKVSTNGASTPTFIIPPVNPNYSPLKSTLSGYGGIGGDGPGPHLQGLPLTLQGSSLNLRGVAINLQGSTPGLTLMAPQNQSGVKINIPPNTNQSFLPYFIPLPSLGTKNNLELDFKAPGVLIINNTPYKTNLPKDLTQKAPEIFSPYTQDLIIPPPFPFASGSTPPIAPVFYSDLVAQKNNLRLLENKKPTTESNLRSGEVRSGTVNAPPINPLKNAASTVIDKLIDPIKTVQDIGKWLDDTIYYNIEQPILDFTAKPRQWVGEQAKKADDLAMKATDFLGIKTPYIITKTGVKWSADFIDGLWGIGRHPIQTTEGVIGFGGSIMNDPGGVLNNIKDTASNWLQEKVTESVNSPDKATENITYAGLEIVSLFFGGAIGKTGKINDLTKFTKMVNKLDNLEDIAKAAKYLNNVEDAALLTKALKEIKDLNKAALVLDQIEDASKITKAIARYGDYVETAALLDKMKDSKKVAAVMNSMEDTKRASLIFKEMKDVDKAAQILKQIGPEKSKSLLAGYNNLEKSAQIINRLEEPLTVKANLFKEANMDELVKYQQKFVKLQPKYQQSMQSIAKDIGIQVDVAEIKDINRIAEKAIGDYGGDISRVEDMLRSSFVIDSLEDIPKVRKAIENKYGNIRFKDHIQNPPADTHYHNFHMNVRLDTGEMVEIKVVPRDVYEVGAYTHKLYEVERIKPNPDFSKIQEINDAAWQRFSAKQK